MVNNSYFANVTHKKLPEVSCNECLLMTNDLTNRTTILYIISDIDKALAFEWIAEELDITRYQLSFLLLNSENSFLEKYLIEKKIEVKRIPCKTKTDMLFAFLKILFFLLKKKPDIVHAHLFKASFAGLLAAKIAGIKKRIYTRHHSSFNHVYFPHAVKYDRTINLCATDIVAISRNVRNILIEKEKTPPSKIRLIHHGFKLGEFENVPANRTLSVRNKYGIVNQFPVIGVISRYIHWKGLQYIIPAFIKLLSDYPGALLILANTQGDYKPEIKKMLQNIPQKNYIEISFENDLFALYKIFDVFVHAPIDNHSEAFGQIYVEALAAGVPSVFTLSGIANEFINNKNAVVVPHKNSDGIYYAIREIMSKKNKYQSLTEQGKKDVRQFALENMIRELEKLYR